LEIGLQIRIYEYNDYITIRLNDTSW